MNQGFDQIFSPSSKKILKLALDEDIGNSDVTSELLIPKQTKAEAIIKAKEDGIFCGAPLITEIFKLVDASIQTKIMVEDGQSIKNNRIVTRLSGPLHAILKAERTALNFLGLLSGVATETRKYVHSVKNSSVLILDTRKTLPLLRQFVKYAVRIGGGRNHRMGLFDALFVKENHRRFGRLEKLIPHKYNFQIEVRNMNELRHALTLSPRVILFDNFKPDRLQRAVSYARARKPEIILEASGGITLSNVAHYAAMGVDCISIGALTHSVKSFDFSLLVL